jgi:hypothetical protein
MINVKVLHWQWFIVSFWHHKHGFFHVNSCSQSLNLKGSSLIFAFKAHNKLLSYFNI